MRRTAMLVAVSFLFGWGCNWDRFCAQGDCGDLYSDCGECGACAYGNCNPCEGMSNDNWGCEDPYARPYYCEQDWECGPDETCVEGQCTWQYRPYCDSTVDCSIDQVCSVDYECVDVVLNCPLTEECLSDPEGYTPEWIGVDPLYMGEVSGNGLTARIEMLVDFYADHLYGEVVAVVESGGEWGYEWVNLIITGDRSGAVLEGQVVERDTFPRRFDATYTAELVTASEIEGTVWVASDAGDFTFSFHLYRVSPCGCDAVGCVDDSECPADSQCVNGVCVPACTRECCENADCPQGDECVDGACLTPCSGPCQCGQEEDCVDGYCVPA